MIDKAVYEKHLISPPQSGAIKKIAIALAVVIAAASVFFGSYFTVNGHETAVVLLMGEVHSTANPGLNFKIPFAESVVTYDNQPRAIRWDQETNADYREEAYSSDQQPAKLSLSVIWHVPANSASVQQLYKTYVTADAVETNLINRRVPQDVKTVFGRYTAVSAIQDRSKLNDEIQSAVKNDPDIASAPIVIDGVQIEDVSFSQNYVNSVEAAMEARVGVQKLEQQKQQREIDAQITVINAKAEAEANVASATAAATATKLRGEAEAAAIRAKGDALRDNPQLVDLTKAERWNGVLPTTMIPGTAVPFISTSK